MSITITPRNSVHIDFSRVEDDDLLAFLLENGQVIFLKVVARDWPGGPIYRLTFDERWLPDDLVQYSQESAQRIEQGRYDGYDYDSPYRTAYRVRKELPLTYSGFLQRGLLKDLSVSAYLAGDSCLEDAHLHGGERGFDIGRWLSATLREPRIDGREDHRWSERWEAAAPIQGIQTVSKQAADNYMASRVLI